MRTLVRVIAVTAMVGSLTIGPVLAGAEAVAAAEEQGAVPKAVFMEGRSMCPGSVKRVMGYLSGKVADRLEELQTKYESEPAFRGVVYDGADVWLVVDASSVDEWAKRLAGTSVRVAPSCVDADLIASAHAAVRGMRLGKNEMAAAGYNALLDIVEVAATRDPATLTLAVQSDLRTRGAEAKLSTALATETFDVRELPPGNWRASRTNDTAPFFGGGRTHAHFNGGGAQCTTGFYINSATNGTVMVTAGHCTEGLNGVTVWNAAETASLGKTESNFFPNPDLTVIDGSSYYQKTFGANDQTTTKSITGENSPSTGVTYCQYGSTSLRLCYQYSDMSDSFCDEAGCTTDLAYAYGPSGPGGSLGSGGDSGGGVYRELSSTTVSARAIVVARGCTATRCEAWDHKRITIINTYDATVFTE